MLALVSDSVVHEGVPKSDKHCPNFVIKLLNSDTITKRAFFFLQVLDSTQSHKTARRVEEVLRRIGVGLQTNSSITPQILLMFIHGITRENIPLLKPKPE